MTHPVDPILPCLKQLLSVQVYIDVPQRDGSVTIIAMCGGSYVSGNEAHLGFLYIFKQSSKEQIMKKDSI